MADERITVWRPISEASQKFRDQIKSMIALTASMNRLMSFSGGWEFSSFAMPDEGYCFICVTGTVRYDAMRSWFRCNNCTCTWTDEQLVRSATSDHSTYWRSALPYMSTSVA